MEREVGSGAPPGKLWGGRFSSPTDPVMESFSSSLELDKRLWKEDIEGSKVYAAELEAAGVLTAVERQAIEGGLDCVADEWRTGRFELRPPADEDVHTANERRLAELIGGAVAGKLHTGRSRNDQVTTDLRLWLRSRIDELDASLRRLLGAFARRARAEAAVIMPAYTHLQRAQPVRWSHWLLSHAWPLRRDLDRLREARSRVDVLPLGSGAVAGCPLAVDRRRMAAALGFASVAANSMDATMERDYVTEFLFWAALVGQHLSRWAEDLIVHGTAEFGYVSLSDAYATGSSLMPQKRNPDAVELIRAKAGTLFGRLAGFFVCMKGLPSAYNRDLQEDKAALFDAVDAIDSVLRVAAGVVDTLRVNGERCRAAVGPDVMATELAYYLVRKGVPFREAHGVAGRCVALAESTGRQLDAVAAAELRDRVDPRIGDDVATAFDVESSVERYATIGGTALQSLLDQVSLLEDGLRSG